jgi:LysM repeat protein
MTYSSPSTLGRLLEVIAGFLLIIVPLSVHAGVFSLFAEKESVINEVVKTELVLDEPVLTAAINSDPKSARGGADLLVVEGALVSTGPIGEDELAESRQNSGEISVYTVREGDSLSMIAEMFDVTANTILWANDLPSAKSIKPGQTLIILPIAGVRHVVKSGDTLASIAKKYDGDVDEIRSYNQLAEGEGLTLGGTIIVPGGAMHATAPVKVAVKGGVSGAKSGGNFSHPAPGTIKTQGIHGYNAVDFAGAVGTAVRAALPGEVIVSKSSGWNGGYGQYIVVKHANGSQTLYAHLSSNSVGVGAMVEAGQVIGAMGNTGKSTGPHLHFEVRGARNPF